MMGHYLGPYDNYQYAIAVDSGDKELGTDIHTMNQKKLLDYQLVMQQKRLFMAGLTDLAQHVLDGVYGLTN